MSNGSETLTSEQKRSRWSHQNYGHNGKRARYASVVDVQNNKIAKEVDCKLQDRFSDRKRQWVIKTLTRQSKIKPKIRIVSIKAIYFKNIKELLLHSNKRHLIKSLLNSWRSLGFDLAKWIRWKSNFPNKISRSKTLQWSQRHICDNEPW